MKSIQLFPVALLLINLTSCSENDVAPTQVQDAFAAKYPNATNVKWEKEKDEWEAEYFMDGKEYSSNYNETGTWLETENDLQLNEVPSETVALLHEEYTNADIEEVELSVTPEGTFYEFKINIEGNDLEVVIDAVSGELTTEIEDED